ncbi:hypothetical protein IQ270_21535 [Microcoleus sp. LEGE 07076]|uniref:hypothetical protein n=1 Tax=Microcoleus sp. LEGE 07076 TaxID=915322 RepID=UPI0018821F68|nr:hypothetical protein [Microcoleus sp. LEGE 07076]MBE9187165.1 hypothetical protein [Microcoleus sp. LEGE 07076]
MSSPKGRSSKIEFSVLASHPELLTGLDAWLRLGLISPAEVEQLCRQYLVCPLPEPALAVPQPKVPALSTQKALSSTTKNVARLAETTQHPSFISQILHSLIAEISVVWLLFLGVFMVVVSSGVLAASQWERFPAAGQYGVLLAYTLTFWAISSWAKKQSNLHLTAQTLQEVTLLLVPINFWAMDTFGLWQYPWNWVVAIVAAFILTWITRGIIKDQYQSLWGKNLTTSIALNHLGLSYLHWAWAFPGFSLAAVYLGTVGTAAATVYQVQQQRVQSIQPGGNTETIAADFSFSRDFLNYKKAALIAYSLGILLGRAIFVKGVDIAQMGLALGICGVLLAWLDWPQSLASGTTRNNISNRPNSGNFFNWQLAGGVLLGLGWLVCFREIPLQAIAISALAVWFFYNRLVRFWQKFDLLMLFAVGLQSIWLVWRVVPLDIKTQFVAVLTGLTNSGQTPWAFWGVLLLPYLILIVSAAQWLYRSRKFPLAHFGENLALGLGSVLTVISLLNPFWRSLNLVCSTFILAWIVWKYAIPEHSRPVAISDPAVGSNRNPAFLVAVTHIIGLCAIASTIDLFLPNLTLNIWALVLLMFMAAEWGFFVWMKAANLRENSAFFRWHPALFQSSWYLGLGLAGLSFILLENYLTASDIVDNPQWSLLWLVTPLALTGVAKYTEISHKQVASIFSTIALIVAQLLMFPLPGYQLIGLGFAALLMLVNTYYLVEVPEIPAAAIGVGFGLMFVAGAIDRLGFVSGWAWAIAGAIALLCLWLLRSTIIRYSSRLPQPSTLAKMYDRALDGWAILLAALLLTTITVYSYDIYTRTTFSFSPSVQVLAATLVIMAAIVFRSLRQVSPLAIYALAWSLELLTAVGLSFIGRNTINLAVANIAIGLFTQLLGDWWRRRNPDYRTILPSIHVIPLVYGLLGLILRSHAFTNSTGLISLGASLIAIGIGRRQQQFKPLVYLGLIGVSASAYESLLYQLSQTPGAAFGDGLIVLATLGTTLTYIYRILSPWLSSYLHLTNAELKIFAHLHWVLSSILLIWASTHDIKSGLNLGLVTGTLLVQYAFLQGRNNLDRQWAEIWIYLGWLEAFGIRLYWINTPLVKYISGPLGPWKVAIASLFAYFIYILPWDNWGWSKNPWKIIASLIPIITIVESPAKFYPISFLIAAAFYVFLAWEKREVRFTYVSVAIIDWILLRWFGQIGLTQPEWYFTPLGLSFLYVAQFVKRSYPVGNRALQLPAQKTLRHNLRMLATALICGIPLLTQQSNGLVAGFFSLVAIAAGLALRVRAFLFVGTGIFLINVFYQLVVLIFDYPLIKWAIGLAFGIVFIWIAATFETRRDRISAFVQHWVVQLQSWD